MKEQIAFERNTAHTIKLQLKNKIEQLLQQVALKEKS